MSVVSSVFNPTLLLRAPGRRRVGLQVHEVFFVTNTPDALWAGAGELLLNTLATMGVYQYCDLVLVGEPSKKCPRYYAVLMDVWPPRPQCYCIIAEFDRFTI